MSPHAAAKDTEHRSRALLPIEAAPPLNELQNDRDAFDAWQRAHDHYARTIRARSVVYPSRPLVGANPMPIGDYVPACGTNLRQTFHAADPAALNARRGLLDADLADESTAAMAAEPESARLKRYRREDAIFIAVCLAVGAALALMAWLNWLPGSP